VILSKAAASFYDAAFASSNARSEIEFTREMRRLRTQQADGRRSASIFSGTVVALGDLQRFLPLTSKF
jgi:hypothetical protein